METSKQITATFQVPTEVLDKIVAEITTEITSKVMTKMSETMRTISDLLIDEVSTVKTAVKTMVENKVSDAIKTVTGASVQSDYVQNIVSEVDENKPEQKIEVEESAAEAEQAKKEPAPLFDFMAIQKYCEDVINNVLEGKADGNFDKEDENILKMSKGLVHAYLGKCRGFSPRFNFRNTKQVTVNQTHFNGFLKPHRIASVLENSFKNYVPEEAAVETVSVSDDIPADEYDCDTPVSERKKRRGTPFKNQSYAKVAGGSNMMKIRVRSNGTIAPMVVDREFGADMIENHFTHVTLVDGKDGAMYMVFTEQENRTHAPNKSKKIARLSIYGRNHKNGEPTTFTISSQKFQQTILEHFHFDMNANKEFFIKFTEGTRGVHNSTADTSIFKKFAGKKYYSIRLTSES